MRQDDLKPLFPRKKKKRVGRGPGSGRGKTAGRGTKGQKSRAGYKLPVGFEGGQTPLKMRIPKKKGFFRKKKIFEIINLDKINDNFKKGEVISPENLYKKKLIKSQNSKVKILGNGNLEKSLVFENVSFSKQALEKINKIKKEK